ncbi:unnamed protein product, partial [Musa acuminata subsp. malaccensis]
PGWRYAVPSNAVSAGVKRSHRRGRRKRRRRNSMQESSGSTAMPQVRNARACRSDLKQRRRRCKSCPPADGVGWRYAYAACFTRRFLIRISPPPSPPQGEAGDRAPLGSGGEPMRSRRLVYPVRWPRSKSPGEARPTSRATGLVAGRNRRQWLMTKSPLAGDPEGLSAAAASPTI